MTSLVSPAVSGFAPAGSPAQAGTSAQADNIGKRFEQMLWAEMLSHAGLEESLTQNGGQAASSFSRYLIEAIAEDISEKHPLGLGQAAGTSVSFSGSADSVEKP